MSKHELGVFTTVLAAAVVAILLLRDRDMAAHAVLLASAVALVLPVAVRTGELLARLINDD